jgi:glycosyltransferase involved in cell wall biosynthesis
MELENHPSGLDETPLVSVITPAYKHVNLLPRAVLSALSQTHHQLEVIVVDDGSPEDVKAALSAFDDPRLIYLRREKDQGVAAARNWGIENSEGGYIAFLDSDDEWKGTKLEAQLSRLKLKGPSFKACYTRREQVDDATGKVTNLSPYDKEGDVLADTLYRPRFLLSSVMVERDLLLKVRGFDERIRFGEDWELYLRLAQRTLFAFVDEPLTLYHSHKGQVTNTQDGNKSYVESLRMILEKHQDLYRKDRKAWSSLLNQIGYYQMTCGMKKEARSSFLSSIRHDPYQKRAYVSLARMIKGWN